MNRPSGDDAWSYIRPPPPLMKQIWPELLGDNNYEFVFLRDYPGRTETNSDDPPESYHSKDLYTPHPSIPNAWKCIGPLDDRVTLVNGEKVLPLSIEGRIREKALVREAVVFGVTRSIPGLLAFRAEATKEMSNEDFVNTIWPAVEAANEHAEEFSQIGKNMIVPLPAAIAIPLTDKGSMIRAQMYNVFEKETNKAYHELEGQEGYLKLNLSDLTEHIMELAQQIIGPQLSDPDTDFFGAGMNSLQAIQLRRLIVRDLDLGGNAKKLTENIIFDTGNGLKLAKHLLRLRLNENGNEKAEYPIVEVKDMIETYSAFQKHARGSDPEPDFHTVILTGATGSLGAHLLSQLLAHTSSPEYFALCVAPTHSPMLPPPSNPVVCYSPQIHSKSPP